MNIKDTDQSQPERLPHNATTEERFIKFSKIVESLKLHGINLVKIDNYGCPVLEYNGSNLTQNIITWQIFKVDEVVSMILDWKNKL